MDPLYATHRSGHLPAPVSRRVLDGNSRQPCIDSIAAGDTPFDTDCDTSPGTLRNTPSDCTRPEGALPHP